MTMGTGEVRRLARRTHEKVVAGVAGGLGDYFGVDPLWFRLGFVLSLFAGGAGLIAYVVLWVLMPKDDGTAPNSLQRRAETFARSFRGTPSWAGIALIVVGVFLFLTAVAHWQAHPGLLWGIGLIVAGIALFTRHEAADAVAPDPPTVILPAPPRGDAGVAASASDASLAAPPVRAARERSPLGWITIGTMLIALGAAALLDVSGTIHIRLVQYLAIPLALLGVGLIAGAWWGRARWLVVPAILLTPFVAAASLVHVPFAGGSGNVTYAPVKAADVRPAYHIVAGEMIIDLEHANLAGTPVRLRATAVAGRIIVRVPPGAAVAVHGRVGGGEVDLFGRSYDGLNVDVRRTFAPATPRSPSVVLDLEASFGKVEVESLEVGP